MIQWETVDPKDLFSSEAPLCNLLQWRTFNDYPVREYDSSEAEAQNILFIG